MTPVAAPVRPRPNKIVRLTPIVPEVHYHPIRKAIHLACFGVFVVLPFFNVIRFDIPRERFYFAGQELWINEFGIIFFALMFLMFLIAAASMFYGRMYCGYLCPQTIFSEASTAVERAITHRVDAALTMLKGPARRRIAAGLFYLVLAVGSVFLSFVFISYFVEPRDLLHRLLRLDIVTAGGVSGAATALVTFLDFALVRQTFCTTVCPYGYIQGILGDDDTLLVEYRDRERLCIECGKCIRVCEMGIDIRTSAHQIECTHCGECIDACADVMGKLGYKGLIHYVWGEKGEALGQQGHPWYHRIGFRDAKRVAVSLVLLFYASGLAVALSMRHPVLVQVSPDRSRLFWVEGNQIRNHFRLTAANRTSRSSFVTFSIDGIPAARMLLPDNPLTLAGGQQWQGEFEIAVPKGALRPGVNPFRLTARSEPGGDTDAFSMTFIMPAEGPTP